MTANLAVFLNLAFLIGRIVAILLALVIGFNIMKQLTIIANELKKANATKPQSDNKPEQHS